MGRSGRPRRAAHQWQLIAPQGCDVYNPAFDVTPHELVAGIFTEDGVIRVR